MKSTFRTITYVFITVFTLFFTISSFAQKNVETVFTDKEAGISFEIPMGWNAHPIVGGYMLQSCLHNSYTMILPLTLGNEENIFANLNRPSLYDIQGVELLQKSNIYQSTEGFMMAKMEGQMGWKDMQAYACVVQTSEREGFIVLVGNHGEKENLYYEKLADKLAKSLKVKKSSFELLASTF